MQTSRDWATAAVRLTGDGDAEAVVSGAAIPVRRKTDQANLSMSLSVTSHKLATRAGLQNKH